MNAQVSAHYVFQHGTLSTGLRSHHYDLRKVYRILNLKTWWVSRQITNADGQLALTPTVVKTSCSLLTSAIRLGSFTLILQQAVSSCHGVKSPWLNVRVAPRSSGHGRRKCHSFRFVQQRGGQVVRMGRGRGDQSTRLGNFKRNLEWKSGG